MLKVGKQGNIMGAKKSADIVTEVNKVCRDCIKTCKQTNYVKVIYCPFRIEKK